MNKYEAELTRLVSLGEEFIPPPPMLTDAIHIDKEKALENIIKNLVSYQEITGRTVETRILLYQSELDLFGWDFS